MWTWWGDPHKGMGGDTLWTWHKEFTGIRTSPTCKGKEEFKVTTGGAGEVLTWELKTCSHIIMNNLRWTIFQDILQHVTKQDLSRSGHEGGMIKRAKKVKSKTVISFTWFMATVPINVFQILLNPLCLFFSNKFRWASDTELANLFQIVVNYNFKGTVTTNKQLFFYYIRCH